MNPFLKPLMVYFQTVWCPFCKEFSETVLPPYRRNDMIDIEQIEVKPRYLEYYERYDLSLSEFENPWIHGYVAAGRETPDGKPSVPCVLILSAAEKERLYNEPWNPPIGKYIFSGITKSKKQELAAKARGNPDMVIRHYTRKKDRGRYNRRKLFEIAKNEFIKSQAQRMFFNKVRQEIAKVVPQNRQASINTKRYMV